MDFEKLAAFRNRENLFSQKLGIVVTEIGPGYARATKTFQPDDRNPAGLPHGGAYFTLADTASASAAASCGYHTVTVSSSYNFLRSAKIGDTVTAEARQVHSGKSISVYDVQLTTQEGLLVGTACFTFYVLDRKIEL